MLAPSYALTWNASLSPCILSRSLSLLSILRAFLSLADRHGFLRRPPPPPCSAPSGEDAALLTTAAAAAAAAAAAPATAAEEEEVDEAEEEAGDLDKWF